MNHLSHLFLSGDDPDTILGNFIADFLSPKEQRIISEPIKKGILLHLFIDHTIDHDAIFKQSIQLIKTGQGKYAPVVADIFYDYLLVHHWDEFSSKDFFTFKTEMYAMLLNALNDSIPLKAQQRVKRMVQHDFLSSYLSFFTIPSTFEFLKRRVKFEHQFDNALNDFNAWYPQLDQQFLLVFPMMCEKVKEFGINLQNLKRS